MKTIEAVKGKEFEVLSYFGITQNGNKHQTCPICERKKKFRINVHNNTVMYICTCSSGDIFKLLMQTTGLDFKHLANDIDRIIGNAPDYEAPITPRRNYEKELLQLWRTLKPVRNTSVQRYLNSRGIYKMPMRAVKVSGTDDKSVMFSVATNDKSNPVMTHQTYLEGDSKANVEVQKRTSKVDKERESTIEESIAIRMFDSQTCLGISEGVESALSAHQLYECVVWAVLNTNFMKKFRAPGGVEHLIIFGDGDSNGAGQAAAFVCGNANILCNNDVKKVTIRFPESGDFNDVLQETQKINEFILTK